MYIEPYENTVRLLQKEKVGNDEHRIQDKAQFRLGSKADVPISWILVRYRLLLKVVDFVLGSGFSSTDKLLKMNNQLNLNLHLF